jgi:7-keto-8-aminopelargonate synthetase-like enzyme
MSSVDATLLKHVEDHYSEYTLDMFAINMSDDLEEMELFYKLYETVKEKHLYAWESVRDDGAEPEIDILRADGEQLHVINLATYNYLGYNSHPDVIKAATEALQKYGLGTCSSPVIGKCLIHQQFEDELVRHYDLPTHQASLFNSGYAVNLGAIQAFIKPGNCVLLDANVHMSIAEGAKLSGGTVAAFEHNNMTALEALLKKHCDSFTRVLICVDGLYSCDGDRADLKGIVRLAKQYGAFTLVDEAHSVLIAGEYGRGVCEEQDVVADIDMIVVTFSKGFASVGGAVIARKEIAQYLNLFANTRFFTCSLPPATVGGMLKILELSKTADGRARRERVKENSAYFRGLLRGKVNLGTSDSWIVTVSCGKDSTILETHNYLQKSGLDASVMAFPAVPKNDARMRMFVTADHSKEQLKRAAEIILDTAQKFDFLLG